MFLCIKFCYSMHTHTCTFYIFYFFLHKYVNAKNVIDSLARRVHIFRPLYIEFTFVRSLSSIFVQRSRQNLWAIAPKWKIVYIYLYTPRFRFTYRDVSCDRAWIRINRDFVGARTDSHIHVSKSHDRHRLAQYSPIEIRSTHTCLCLCVTENHFINEKNAHSGIWTAGKILKE